MIPYSSIDKSVTEYFCIEMIREFGEDFELVRQDVLASARDYSLKDFKTFVRMKIIETKRALKSTKS